MAASLGRNLIFEDDSRSSGRFEFPNGALHLRQIAVASIAVGDQGNRDATADSADLIRHFRHGQEVEVRQPQQTRRASKSTDEQRYESGLLDNERAEHVVRAHRREDSRTSKQLAKARSGPDD